jgi:MYXO-CTERM domain-containing protein
VAADHYRDDLCENLSYCEHGFWRPAPLSLFDGQSHEVNAAVDYGMSAVELTGSPASFECAPITPTGALRPVSDATFEAWSFSSFWDEAPADAGGLPRGNAWPDAPELVSDGTDTWVIDGGVRRRVESEESAIAWHFGEPGAGDPGALPEGDPLPMRPVLLRTGGALYLLDGEIDPQGPPTGPPEGGLPGDDPAAGCGCRVAGHRSSLAETPANIAWLSAFALVLAGLRRRRRTLV